MSPTTVAALMPVPCLEGFRLPSTDTAARLADEVAAIVRDPSFASGEILELLNRGLLEIAGKVRLPGLETSAELSLAAGSPRVALPADFHRDLFAIHCRTSRRALRLESGLAALMSRHPGGPGRPLAAAVSGLELFVLPAPAAPMSLTIGYRRVPERLEALTDKVLCLPPHLVAPLLVNYACRELFERLEEGQDGNKVQTGRHEGRFAAALADLEAFFHGALAGPVEVAQALPGLDRGVLA